MAYHLPLDAHPTLGNNAQLGKVLGIGLTGYSGDSNIIANGNLDKPVKLYEFVKKMEAKLQRTPLVIGDLQKMVRKIAWYRGCARLYRCGN